MPPAASEKARLASRDAPAKPASRSSTPVAYAVALSAVIAATVLRWLLDPVLGNHLPYVTYFVAVAFVAWRCDLGPSLFALLVGGWAADFFFFSPRYLWYPHGSTPAHIVGISAYFVVGLSSIAVSQLMRRAQRRSDRDRELLRVTLASIGDAVMTTDAQGRITSLNAMAEVLTGWRSEEAAGRPIEEVFRIVNEDTRQPVDNPAARVLATGRVVGLANHTILLGKDGVERPIDDSAAPIHDATGKVLGVVLVFRDVTEERKSARVLRDSEARKAAILDTALDCIITIDHRGCIVEFNPAAERTFGHARSDVLGREMGELIVPPAMRQRHREGIARYLATGEGPVLNRRIELTALRADGSEFPVELAITPITGMGDPMFTGHLRDITDRKQAEERQRLLTNELNHRVKNTLAIMQSIANQTARATSDPKGFIEAFSARLQAMARTHDVLTRSAWSDAELREMVELTLAPYHRADRNQVEVDGPRVLLSPNAAVALGLVLNELATNAAKYGAFSQPAGRVAVRWELPQQPPRLVVEWQERGGPPVAKPARRGFGTRLIEMVATQLGGTFTLTHDPAGVSCRMEMPVERGLGETPLVTGANPNAPEPATA